LTHGPVNVHLTELIAKLDNELALPHNYIGTERGLLAVPLGQAARTLIELGIGVDAVRAKVHQALSGFTKSN
jgi:hypothetical protein